MRISVYIARQGRRTLTDTHRALLLHHILSHRVTICPIAICPIAIWRLAYGIAASCSRASARSRLLLRSTTCLGLLSGSSSSTSCGGSTSRIGPSTTVSVPRGVGGAVPVWARLLLTIYCFFYDRCALCVAGCGNCGRRDPGVLLVRVGSFVVLAFLVWVLRRRSLQYPLNGSIGKNSIQEWCVRFCPVREPVGLTVRCRWGNTVFIRMTILRTLEDGETFGCLFLFLFLFLPCVRDAG